MILSVIPISEKGVKPSMPNSNDQKKETNMQATYKALKHMIINNQLPTGVPIPQTRLMEEYGFSRTPLREAINKLAQDGLVHLEQNKRISIIKLTEQDIDEISSMRIVLECFAVLTSVPLLTEEDLSEAARYLDEADACLASGDDFASFEISHRKFHSVLRKYAGAWLTHDIELCNEQSARYRAEYRLYTRNYNREEHDALLDAARRHDALQTAQLLATHYAKTTLIVIAEKTPKFNSEKTRLALKLIDSLEL